MATLKEMGEYYRNPRDFGPELKPYTAVALQIGSPAIYKREEIKTIAIPHIRRLANMTIPGASGEFPVRLIALTEAGLQGWDAEYALGNQRFCQDMAVEVPGEETHLLGEQICKKHNIYLVGTLKTLEPDIIKDRYFNCAFLINPKGEVILKHFKLQVANVERSTTPHDVWDRYVARYGDGLDAFFQVADTEIGRIGMTICYEGIIPEIYRGYALQGAEVVTHPDFILPYVSRWGPDWWALINRTRALENNFYMVCTGAGPLYHKGHPDEPDFTMSGGRSMIVDYRGVVLSEFDDCMEGFAAATIDIPRLREYRASVTTIGNQLPMIRTEYYRRFYQEPIYPQNAWSEEESTFARYEARIKKSIQELQKRGIFLVPQSKG